MAWLAAAVWRPPPRSTRSLHGSLCAYSGWGGGLQRYTTRRTPHSHLRARRGSCTLTGSLAG
eukprot:1367512-Alexandrium_andersonii.AAC.1